ncbi:MAG: MiaB/RimO family radical SAM methylthiotransferase, partial [Terriglobia bacterium]
MVTFHILSFGCRASQADGAALRGRLLGAGLVEASGGQGSDVAVLNTCTVTAAADAEVRQTIRRIHREKPDCRILVTGCYAQRAPQEIACLEGVASVVGNSHKHQVAEIVQQIAASARRVAPLPAVETGSASPPRPTGSDSHPPLGPATVRVGEIGREFHFSPAIPGDRTRPTLKIQDGCNARCSFCIIPAVRGRSRSLPPAQVIDEIREMDRKGYKEVVLSGINLGSYGRDLAPPATFLELIEKILDETAILRLRISSIEPMDVSMELIGLAAREPRLADHFHIPLQSGSDRILRQMNRRYWTSQYAERAQAVREMIPHAGLGADVMVGFPGETSEDHAASVRFIDSIPFTYLHIFPYS